MTANLGNISRQAETGSGFGRALVYRCLTVQEVELGSKSLGFTSFLVVSFEESRFRFEVVTVGGLRVQLVGFLASGHGRGFRFPTGNDEP